ncbi:sulfate transporter family-domain-containing protein [Hygrophoropsis aurantiaca]|uniref:Sulfate transporter family-domain-containing protein n=1 Tax=Hygrophoropsis aurantiaca TaxID=72124 RepID=A0ACB8A4G3_9AGAM|nr:sulfate transporter family-domain-containing protein [Hygrophoropsis aurantiaca]
MSTRPGDHRGLSTATSSSSLQNMMQVRAQERTPLVPEGDIEAGRAQYGGIAGGDASSESDTDIPKHVPKWARMVQYYVPSTAWIPNYSLSLLGGDVISGVTIAAMGIPVAVSYGTSLAKLTPTTALFAAGIPPIMYSLLGTSRQVMVAGEATLSLLVGQAVSDFRRNGPHSHSAQADTLMDDGFAIATAITFQVGLFTSILGFFRLGFLDVVLSRALLRGFITAVAVVINIEQLITMFGMTALEKQLGPESSLDKLMFFVANAWDSFHKPTLLVSLGTLLGLILMRSFKGFFKPSSWIQRLPEVLVVVVVSTYLCGTYRWDNDGVLILGAVPISTGSHFFQFPLSGNVGSYIRGTTSTAILISVIGFLDSIVAAKQMADRFGNTISPNRELVALGASNLLGSCVPGTLPAFGSLVRARMNGDLGGRTQMASLVCAAVVLLSTFFLLPYLFFLPTCVLASIIFLFVSGLFIEVPEDLVFYYRIAAWTDLGMMFMTFIISVVWNVEIGIVVSIIMSLLLVINRSSKTRLTILGRLPGTDQWRPVADHPEAEDVPGALIVRIRESLDFANTAQLKERLRRLELYGPEHAHPSEEPRREAADVLVFHMGDVETCDASAVQIFRELLTTYQNRGVGLYVTHLRPDLREMFERANIVKLLGEDAFYETLGDAMAKVEQR